MRGIFKKGTDHHTSTFHDNLKNVNVAVWDLQRDKATPPTPPPQILCING